MDVGHMKSEPSLRNQLVAATDRDCYNNYCRFRPFESKPVPSADIKAYVDKAFKAFSAHFHNLCKHREPTYGKTRRTDVGNAANDFFEQSQRFCDAIMLEMGNIREQAHRMREGKSPNHVRVGHPLNARTRQKIKDSRVDY